MIKNDSYYTEMLEQCRTYNNRMMAERRARLPYLDSQTKVAQKDCSLWFEKRHRGPGLKPNQIYSYPAKRWKKRPRFNPIMDPHFDSVSAAAGAGAAGSTTYNTRPRRPVKMSSYNEDYLEAQLLNENSNDSNSLSALNASLMDADNDILENESIGVGSLHMDDDEDFDEEYEAGRSSKKKSKRTTRGSSTRSKKLDTSDEKDRPYQCMYCGKRYKNKAGLQYHIQHIHRDEMEADDEYKPAGGGAGSSPSTSSSSTLHNMIMQQDESPSSPHHHTFPTTPSSQRGGAVQKQDDLNNTTTAAAADNNASEAIDNNSSTTASTSTSNNNAAGTANNTASGNNSAPAAAASGEDTSGGRSKRKTGSGSGRPRQSNDYCDFCLGDAFENKKTGVSEQLVSCSDCGRSAHPTCLQFTDIMTANVKKYSWQCIECKSCHVCGTSDNDDQLLFCDDCDRGYHMYCLTPRMEQPPEGIWICSLCEADKRVRESGKTTLSTL